MINIEQVYGRELKISYYNQNGDIAITKVVIPESQKYRWQEWHEGIDHERYRSKEFVSHDNKPVKKVIARSLDKYRIMELINNYMSVDFRDKVNAFNPPKKWFMDIETEIIDGFPDVYNPVGKVLSNSFCNQNGDVYITGIKPLTLEQKKSIKRRINEYFADLSGDNERLKKTYNVKIKEYKTEAHMLSELFYNYIPKMPLITGWNFLKFDWAYLTNRCKLLGVKPERASPTGNTYSITLRDKWNPTVRYKIDHLPYHRGVVDYMMIYEKWDTSVKLKSSVNLDFVAEEVLGLSKVAYPGTLMDLYRNDYETYLFYNAVDTILVALIDEKLQTFSTMQKLACEGRTSLHDAAFASAIIESLFSDVFYKKGKVFIRREDIPQKDKYAGAFVYEPKRGMFDDCAIYDFESQFPAVMMFGNVGIDTYLGKTHDEGKTYLDHEGKTHVIKSDEHIWLASGAVYSKKEDSVMRMVCSQLFDERIIAKKAGGIINSEIAELEEMLKTAK